MLPALQTRIIVVGSLAAMPPSLHYTLAAAILPAFSRSNPMKSRGIIVLAVAVALAFAGGAGPRHAQATTQNHDHSAAATHHESDGQHSHAVDAGSDFAEGSAHDHAGSAPASDQGCCYAWCSSVAVIHAADGLALGATHGEHFAFEKSYQIVAFSAAIDPPPR
jgi:hypothetical protein